MTQPYLCAPATISEEIFDTFLFLQDNHCSLSLADFLDHNRDDVAAKRFYFDHEPAFSDEPQRWAEVLFDPEDIIEIRMVPARSAVDKMRPRLLFPKKTASQHGLNLFPFASGINAVVNKLNELNHKSVTWWGKWDKARNRWTGVSGEDGIPLNIYASVNPRFASGCTTNAEVICARNLVADLDKTTLPEALDKLKATGLPSPTMIVISGHGVHFYWRLNKSIMNLARWTTIQKRLIQLLGSDPAIHDPSRPMRVPGFLNVNGDTPVACRIHEADPERRYDLKEILSYLPPSPPEPPKPARPAPASFSPSTDSRPQAPSDNSTIKRATAYAAQFEPVDENRNSTLFSRGCDLADKFDLTEAEILPLIHDNNAKAGNPLDAGEVEEVVAKAVNHVLKKGKQRGTLLQPPTRIEKYVEPSGPVIELSIWREEMKKARLESVNHPGKIFFDGSTTGAGKSTADIEAMKKEGKSATYAPTHDACGDLVKKLRKEGLSAAAHPKLDEDSCQMYGTENKPGPARIALSAGLNVGTCICPTCEFSKTCKFQKQREEARNADHTVATHDRAALSKFKPSKEKPINFVHETPITPLRPMAKVVRFAKKDVAQLRHLQDIALIAQAAEQVAVGWNDDDARNFANRLQRSAHELVAVLTAPDLIQPLEDAAEKGHSIKNLPTVMPLPMKASLFPPRNMDVLLKRAMDQTGILAKGEVLRLVVGFACGELHQLCAVVDEAKGLKGKKIFTKGIVAVWKTELPDDSVIWFEDASSNAPFLKELVGRDVIDKTPNGRLAFTKPPIQFADQDVTQSTSGKTVRAIVRGLLAIYPNANNVGIITHQVHKKEIDKLAPLWQQRISKVEHFHSGKDRASNAWLDCCDLILVLGTPRVNASAIRDGLIRIGRIEDAKINGDFSSLIWEGKTIEGEVLSVKGLGYANPSWNEMNASFVKETLRQAIGRGRAVTEKSVQVVVVTNESIGMSLANQPLPLVDDSEDETLHLALMLTETNPISSIIGKGSVAPVATSDISAINGKSDRMTRLHFTTLTFTGLLTKKGARQGVTVPDWLLAYYSQSTAHCGSPLNEEGQEAK